jgi:hypothetical protein
MAIKGKGRIALIGLLVLVGVGAVVLAVRWPWWAASAAIDTPYQAVFLTNGQMLFGKLSGLGSSYPVLTDVYYVQTQLGQEKKAVSALVRRGKESHAPDRMVINAHHILLVEPVKPDSAVARLIAELKKQE